MTELGQCPLSGRAGATGELAILHQHNPAADQLEDQLSCGAPLEEAGFAALKRTMEEHGAVVFGGDGYSSD